MNIIKVLSNDISEWDYEFDTVPTKMQMDAAMKGIGGRPRDRERLAKTKNGKQKK